MKYLRRKQIAYRLWYFLRHRWRKITGFSYSTEKQPPLISVLIFQPSIPTYNSFYTENTFQFLNLTHRFESEIEWDFEEYGKLWTYNLTYFDFLHQSNSAQKAQDFKRILDTFVLQQPRLKNANEPFPISLRGINWIKYFIKNRIQNPIYNQSLFLQYSILLDNIEYHLLGNHLLENGFSLLFGALYFQHKPFFDKAYDILSEELEEQILEDGAHFELCPMYHKIMLFRVLDCYNLLKNNNIVFENTPSTPIKTLEKQLQYKAELMLSWLKNMTYSDGSMPHFGDSTDGIAPTAHQLMDYAQSLGINQNKNVPLSTSGFRRLTNAQFDLIAKVGKIGPDYIPGHAHADSLSFELHINGKPTFVEIGISTYETNERRLIERSTASHNTVQVAGQNSSEVWGSFRVAQRAQSIITKDTTQELKAQHDGYKSKGILHKRSFSLHEKRLDIIDETQAEVESKAFFHFPPHIILRLQENRIEWDNNIMKFYTENGDTITYENIKIAQYFYTPQYNTFTESKKIEITFKGKLQTCIETL